MTRGDAVLTRPPAAHPDGRAPPGLGWQAATVTQVRQETRTARTFVLRVPGWTGHDPGQDVELRLCRPDRSLAVRLYSIASAPQPGGFDLTIDHQPADPPPLAYTLQPGAATEVRGPAGGRLVWRPEQQEPVQLIAGGSGVVPLMAIIRAHALADSRAPLRLLYSARQPGSVIYHAELKRRDTTTAHLSVTYAYTRTAPPGAALPPGRIDARLLARVTWPPALAATCYIAGPAAFVDTITRLLTSIGHHSDRFRTEHFTAPQPAPPIGAEAGHRLPGTERAA